MELTIKLDDEQMRWLMSCFEVAAKHQRKLHEVKYHKKQKARRRR